MSKKEHNQRKEQRLKWSSAVVMFKQLPFVYFIGILALIYIANAHEAERKMRKIENLKKELKEIRWKYISANADLMYTSTESYIERRVRPAELEVSKEKPNVIQAEP